ncbi:alpha/beta hydrolase [Mucilaginibacter gynuensis]|uniref:Alpha/beta hydrolase n=1 Tax=Mucilaginibacter gynuensis TaxID=1302236 RepID=A0ABP8GFW9_9SPHI
MKENRLYGKFETQNELDAEYDVEKAVPNFEEYISSYQKNSDQVRALLNKRISLPYGATKMETLTIYPADTPNAPVLLFIHGGYWRLGIGDDYDFVAAGPTKAGFTVVIITYALAPAVNIPEMTRQIRSSIAWTVKNIAAYNGNADQLYVAGHSAGAHLAAMALSTRWADYGLPMDIIKGMLLISGLYDLESVAQTFVQPAVRITAEHILWYSPIRLLKPGSIPVIVAWGDQETAAFKEQSANYSQALKSAGNPCSELIAPGKNHFSILNEFETANGLLTRAILSFINA